LAPYNRRGRRRRVENADQQVVSKMAYKLTNALALIFGLWPLSHQQVPEDQELEPEAGVRASAIDEAIEEQAADGIEESEKHDRASWQVGSSRSAGPASEFLDRTPDFSPA
jgi:hypothetical protein